ncbi:MAG: hypothetical protein KF754_12270 [Planctomycetes bacterium]|nr:hypothetical protein [Planctomycetota bacterium]
MATETLEWAVRAAGLGHFALCAASTHIPKALGLKRQFAGLSPLARQLVVMQAGYTFALVLVIGLLSLAGPGLLLDATPLAACVSGFVFAFWFSRAVLQLTYVDKTDRPPGLRYSVAVWGFPAMFLGFAATFGLTLAHNIRGLA